MSAAAACTALVTRDLRSVVRSRSQLYSSILTPLLILVFLGNGVSSGLQPANLPAGGFTAYLVPGIIVMTCVFSSTFSSASFYKDRDSGLLRMLLTSPFSPRVILFGKSLAGVFIGAAQGIVVLLIAAPFVEFEYQYGVVPGLLLGAAVILLLNVFLAGVAQALASRISTIQGFHLLMNLVLFPMLFFSGAFFPLDGLPAWLEILAYLNPLTYAVDAILLAVYAENADAFIGLPIDIAVLLILAAGIYALGMVRLPRLTWSGE